MITRHLDFVPDGCTIRPCLAGAALAWVLLVLLLANVQANQYALVVGVRRYDSEGLFSLPDAVGAEMAAFAELLRGQGSTRSTLFTNTTANKGCHHWGNPVLRTSSSTLAN